MSIQRKKPKDTLEREDMRSEFLFCRTVLHAWEESVADDLEKPGDGWRFSLKCMRCETRRHDVISYTTGELVRRTYDYPDGYKLDETVTRSELRLEYHRRYEFIQDKRSKRNK